MELLETSRRYFKFAGNKDWNFDFGDISAGDGAVWFQRPTIHETHLFEFDTVESCKQWILEYEAAMMEGFEANKRLDKRLYDVKAIALKAEKEWEAVSKYMINAERFNPETDVKVFRTYLANNFRDRDGERFSKPVLNSFNKSIIGKSKLIGHNWGPPGDGRFYDSKIVKMTIDETLEFVDAVPDKKFREHLELIDEKDRGIFWLVPRYYMMNITPEQQQSIINIEAGIWKDMSIGFRAPKKFAIFADGKEKEVSQHGNFITTDDKEDVNSAILFYEFRNDKDVEAEALEGSHVFLGSQFGAQTTKDFDSLEKKIDSLEKVISKLGNSEIGESGNDNDKLVGDDNLKDNKEIVKDEPQILNDAVISDLPIWEIEDKFYWGLVEQELKFWKSKNEPVSVEDFLFLCNRRGFEKKHIIHLIDELDKLKLAEYLLPILDEFNKYFTYRKGDFLIPLDEIEDNEIKYYVTELDKLIKESDVSIESYFGEISGDEIKESKAVWTSAYIKTLENNCFAYVEVTGEKDDEGRIIPNTARHLPHHAKGNGASGTGGTVDLPHLRNGLARSNQVKPVTDTISAAELQSKAKAHLIAHAKKLNIGDYDSFVAAEAAKQAKAEIENVNPDIGESNMKTFEFNAFDVKKTVNDEKFDETMKALQDALSNEEEVLNQKLADLDQKIKDFEDKVSQDGETFNELKVQKEELEGFKKSVIDIFGEEVKSEDMKRAKDTEDAFRDSEIKRALKFGGLVGMIKDQEKELKFFEDKSTEKISGFADYYFSIFENKYPEYAGILKLNNEEIVTVPDPTDVKPKELEQPRSHYRL